MSNSPKYIFSPNPEKEEFLRVVYEKTKNTHRRFVEIDLRDPRAIQKAKVVVAAWYKKEFRVL